MASSQVGSIGETSREENSGKRKAEGREDAAKQIREKMEELYDRIRKGETQQSFQIGGASFTLKEWERFIERFDNGQEELREMIRQAREIARARMAQGTAEDTEREAAAKQGPGR